MAKIIRYLSHKFLLWFNLSVIIIFLSNCSEDSLIKGVNSFFLPSNVDSLKAFKLQQTHISNKIEAFRLNNEIHSNRPLFCDLKDRGQSIWSHGRRLKRLYAANNKSTSEAKTFNPQPNFTLYNTASRTKIPFRALKEREKEVTFYSCGPTVYDVAHIGNFRAFLTYDVLKRWLMVLGYDVQHICNLTDIDDKIIQRMQRDNVSLKDLTNKYANIFQSDLSSLNILPANSYPRATDYIPEMIEMISQLIKKGHAYNSNGSVYFRVQAFKKYGELAKLDKEGQMEGAGEGGGINDSSIIGEKDKENNRDFVLWKAYKEEDGETKWDSPFGPGRPGWHIECSAMARSFLGQTIDLHGGGIDLLFPHHENEKAQSEAANDGAPFCNCWIHNGFVNINNEKMSKSKNNFLTLSSTLPTSFHKRAFRFLIVTSMYRQSLNFTEQSLDAALKNIKRLDKAKRSLEESIQLLQDAIFSFNDESISPSEEDPISADKEDHTLEELEKIKTNFVIAMNDDLNTPRAAASLFSLIKTIEKIQKEIKSMNLLNNETTSSNLKLNAENNCKDDKHKVVQLFKALQSMKDLLLFMDQVFGIYYEVPNESGNTNNGKLNEELNIVSFDELAKDVQTLVLNRNEAKANQDWAKADAYRDELRSAHGLLIKDIKGGTFEIEKV